MPPQLFPATAAAFVPRASSVNVVLGSKVELWLTQILKRINRVKRPLNSVPQHHRCLTETLSSTNAIWTLTSIMLPNAPESELRKDSNPLIEALFNFQLVHIEAYIVHVDMVLRNEVAFKLTPDSIETLIEYYKGIHCVNIAASTYNWLEKELQVKELHEKFIQAINKFIYRTNATALEGLEEEGAGELLCGKGEEVKNNIMNLFHPLLPPALKDNAHIRDNQRQRLPQEYESEGVEASSEIKFKERNQHLCQLVAQYGYSASQQQHYSGGYQQQQPPPQQYGGYNGVPLNHTEYGPVVNSNSCVHGNHQAPPPPTGRRKALLIGINYFGQRGQLQRCINDIKNLSLYLYEKCEYKREDIVILTDDLHDPMSQPTKRNLLMAMHWLVKDARPNDVLFFCYSGHGGQIKGLDSDKPDGYNEVIYPVDFRQVGHIVNDEMHRIMVTPLQPGVRLFTIIDSCHPNNDGGSGISPSLDPRYYFS
ncbi:hypothetical protein V502_00750 [Pseudogymnoascus sp. VKM F-4520 (FW-2644)]|nr:hypothetical protein V502_00750 [Pseudogymnoascus sp. VKM F-4520 (FW-2644)]